MEQKTGRKVTKVSFLVLLLCIKKMLFCRYKNSIDFSVSFYNYHEPSIYPCL